MVTGNLGYNGNSLVVQDIGGVLLSAHAHFDNTNLDSFFIEDVKSGGGKNLEGGSPDSCYQVKLDVVFFDLSK